MRTLLGIGLTLLVLSPSVGAAQWGATLEVGTAWVGGTSRDTASASQGQSFRPHRPTTFGVRFDRRFGSLGAALGGFYAKSGLAEQGPDLAVLVLRALRLYEVTTELSWRLRRSGPGTSVRLHAGSVYDYWDVTGGPARSRWGAHAALSAEWRIGGRVTGTIRASGALTPSLFEQDELPPEFERRAQRRGGVSIGVRWGR